MRAWSEYRGIGGLTFVVSPDQYDQRDSLPRETPPPRQAWGAERVTGPNGTISIEKTAHAKVRQKSTLIGAHSSKEDGQRGIKKIGGKSVKSAESISTGASSRSPLTRPVHTTERVTMPSKETVRCKPMVMDQEWALSLVGLRLKVPEQWWPGYSGNTLYAGQIAAVNFSDNAKRYFVFELDNEENGESYPMRYDAVLLYADKEHPSRKRFNLPEKPPTDPRVTRSGKRKSREEHSRAVSRAQKLQKTSRLAAKKLPNASIKSKSKNSLVIKSTKKSRSTPAPKLLHDKEYFMDCPFQSSSRPTFLYDGLNSSDTMTICLKQTTKTTFFREQFKGRVHRVQKSIDDVPPEKSVTYVSKHGVTDMRMPIIISSTISSF